MLTEFIAYLNEQIGQPYVWGGQHTKLTPDNYKSVIERKENSSAHAKEAIAYCTKKFAEGATVLFGYDCSGLGMWFLQDVKKIYKADKTANGMKACCVDLDTPEPPERGWWTFKVDDKGKAYHIGYMVDDEYVVEAKGRAYGVTKSLWREKDWSCWGIPKCFEDEIRKPTPPQPVPTYQTVIVKGKSVNVRSTDSTKGKVLFTAHKGDEFPFMCVAPSGWYRIETKYPESYITNLSRYTEVQDG